MSLIHISSAPIRVRNITKEMVVLAISHGRSRDAAISMVTAALYEKDRTEENLAVIREYVNHEYEIDEIIRGQSKIPEKAQVSRLLIEIAALQGLLQDSEDRLDEFRKEYMEEEN